MIQWIVSLNGGTDESIEKYSEVVELCLTKNIFIVDNFISKKHDVEN